MNHKNNKSVHFTETQSVKYVDPPTKTEARGRWCSKKEFDRFRAVLKTEAAETRRALAQVVDKEEERRYIAQCVGLECFLSQHVARRKYEIRIEHLNAVLDEQEWQDEHGLYSEERLCRVSERHSMASKERAHRIAVGYLELEKANTEVKTLSMETF